LSGNFNDYIFKCGNPASGNAFSGGHGVENLTIVNTHATGGGIRLGYAVGGCIRNCVVTANTGINTATTDAFAQTFSAEIAIENCAINPGANPSGSIGINTVSDGGIIGCYITGCDIGVKCHGDQTGKTLVGCQIELCKTGLTGDAVVKGGVFKNCGVGIAGGIRVIHGVRIEGAEGTISGNPQYGIQLTTDSANYTIFSGIVVTGQFQQYGIEIAVNGVGAQRTMFIGVQVTNTSTLGGQAWHIPATTGAGIFIGCNTASDTASVSPVAGLPAPVYGIATISWDAGTGNTTLTASGVINFNPIDPAAGVVSTVTVEGVTPSGYNGTFNVASLGGFNKLVYAQSNPGNATGSGASMFAVVNSNSGALEGDCYDVNDSSVNTWGAVALPGGSTHAKVRWSGSNWTVVGV
jgi:hypothetical protein